MNEYEITCYGWENIGENYYSLKVFDDNLQKEGFEYRLSSFPNDRMMIECFPINYGISGAAEEGSYDCNIIFKGKIEEEYDFNKLMNYLEISILTKTKQ